jgi:tetratricopeptide (TPR) repeat protein
VIIVVALLSAGTIARNAEYRNPKTIWADNVAERPLNPRAHFNLGYSLISQNDPATAVPEFRAALDLAPDYYAAARSLGHALEQSGQSNSAEQFYTREIQSFPAFAPQAHLNRGRLRAARGDLAGAESDFQAATRPSRNLP